MAAEIHADNEWSPLKAVILGRAEHSMFPSEPEHIISATMPKQYWKEFKKDNPFPEQIVSNAQRELRNFAAVLEQHGVKVLRPKEINWRDVGGYTGSMPRDGLMSVGNTLIEAHFAWGCRRNEIDLAYSEMLSGLDHAGSSAAGRICRAPSILGHDTIYRGKDKLHKDDSGLINGALSDGSGPWAINNSRPAFDAADFMRFGKTIICQLSNVTNRKGVEYVRAVVPDGYTVEVLEVDDPKAMHIDATLLPLRQGILVYNPKRVTEEELRHHEIFSNWELYAYPLTPRRKIDPIVRLCTCARRGWC
ncbi:L-arginine:L-lysine amidinotransferase [Fulvia fulva]|uniref:Glycine amidinotransferase, mitochondrial n=1 Tax=Passalora fulva TaxID=5499 RepID=A0A9Q8L746_PASFU|nr:L-arginine:L-lysine amidinotransferase [Fulvia fulva]KAK4634429.1 L-arginine:L-lysine amidinotransferase [Fulvia fulva]KAK4638237.1 L-arginine:L-lysine amidinotransferase [Fulvia fulva]UJO12078.1 L-arginine:L-lysine amidinotransferase [Fulvia fulva]WPV10037.1 L-arginine:L-lysine amidinotransferase [Fulvia fulva]WPV23121.1 L-arginine:L-lysine amidinotransferase [Fulvia fulva]